MTGAGGGRRGPGPIAARLGRLIREPRRILPAVRRRLAPGRQDRPPPSSPGPGDPGGPLRVHVGCGPANHLAGWWNTDLRPFPGIDQVLDATEPWPWRNLDAVYGEHFLEHLPPDAALRFLAAAAAALRSGGVLRLSTPSLEWVWRTHFNLQPDLSTEEAIAQTYRANRAFHGWGHRFLYSRPMLERVLRGTGFEALTWHAFGESGRPELRGLERHGEFEVVDGWPSVWIVEAVRGSSEVGAAPELTAELDREFGRFVRSGH